MRRIATEAMRSGAVGFSTSRTLNHRTATGDPTPSLRAASHELVEIAQGMADAGHGVLEMISDFSPDRESELALIRQLVTVSGRPLTLSLAQSHQHPDAWRSLLDEVNAMARAGLPVRAQVAPRPIGVLLGLQASRHPFSDHAAFRPISDRPLADQVRILSDPAFRRRILDDVPETHPRVDYTRTLPPR